MLIIYNENTCTGLSTKVGNKVQSKQNKYINCEFHFDILIASNLRWLWQNTYNRRYLFQNICHLGLKTNDNSFFVYRYAKEF